MPDWNAAAGMPEWEVAYGTELLVGACWAAISRDVGDAGGCDAGYTGVCTAGSVGVVCVDGKAGVCDAGYAVVSDDWYATLAGTAARARTAAAGMFLYKR